MISKINKKIVNFSWWLFCLFFASEASAASIFGRMRAAGSTSYNVSGTDEFSMSKLIGQVISVFISLLGVIFVVLIIFAGYNWMTAAGDSGKVDKAKETLWRAVIGLIITVGAYAIWTWLFFALAIGS